ncbi:hypothetical protein [Streptomyces poonensis]|uniref:hypothetical protein n=1 Tax=Streptomyces poonensis TaxID=68255 RepID=UPI001E2E1AB4|nr:hypothetical protein [Streptomyces poonensis]
MEDGPHPPPRSASLARGRPHRRYALDGVFARALQQVQARADAAGDIEWLVHVDSTIVRAHQHAAATGRISDKSTKDHCMSGALSC